MRYSRRRISETRRARRRMIRESVENKYGIHFAWDDLEQDDKVAINNICKDMTVANFMKFPCKTTEAAKNSDQGATVYLPSKTEWNDTSDFLDTLADKYFKPGMSYDLLELIMNSESYDNFIDDFHDKYPTLRYPNGQSSGSFEPTRNESRRFRKPALTEAQTIRKIARIIAEAEDGYDEDAEEKLAAIVSKTSIEDVTDYSDKIAEYFEIATEHSPYDDSYDHNVSQKVVRKEVGDCIADQAADQGIKFMKYELNDAIEPLVSEIVDSLQDAGASICG